jgi:hypothetical protein
LDTRHPSCRENVTFVHRIRRDRGRSFRIHVDTALRQGAASRHFRGADIARERSPTRRPT